MTRNNKLEVIDRTNGRWIVKYRTNPHSSLISADMGSRPSRLEAQNLAEAMFEELSAGNTRYVEIYVIGPDGHAYPYPTQTISEEIIL